MNMQEMMKQAQRMQQALLTAKKKIDETNYEAENSFAKVVVNGKKQVQKITILSKENLNIEDFETVEDMLMVVINKANEIVDKEIEEKLGSNASGLEGLF